MNRPCKFLLAWLCMVAACCAQSQAEADPALEALVRKSCPVRKVLRSKTGAVVGCRLCPAGTGFAGDELSWKAKTVIRGHFTSRDAEEAVVAAEGCESHQEYFGGTYLLRQVAGRWTRIRYTEGVTTDECRDFRTNDGRDFLVCQRVFTAQEYKGFHLFQVLFDAAGQARASEILTVDDGGGACFEDKVQRGVMGGLEYPDLNGDGLPDLVVYAATGGRALTAVDRRRCDTPGVSPLPVRVRLYRLEYTFDGRRFVPTPETRKKLSAFPKPHLI